MKKVLIFSLAYYPSFIGGDAVAIKEITDRIDPNDIEFHLVTLRFDSNLPKEEKIGNVFVHRIGFTRPSPRMADLKKFPLHLNKHVFQVTAAFAAMRLHRTEKFDGIWAMMAHSAGIPAGIFKFLNPSVPYLLTLQEGDPVRHIERIMRPVWPLFVRSFRKADMVQVLSAYLGKWARSMGFTGPMEIIPNAVDVRKFSKEYPASELEAFKTTLGKRMGDIFLITTSRLAYKNAIDDVIRALPEIPSNVIFIVLGIGADEDELKQLAIDVGVADRVRFLSHIDHTKLPLYLKVSDIFIRASRSEGFGNSFVEAMAVGLPVIATQEGGIADFLFDAKRNPDRPTTGWAVDKDSPEQIAGAVKDIIEHPEKARAVIATAKAMVIEKYDWDLIAKDMKEKVFKKLLT